MKSVREVTKSVRPEKHAVWSLESLHDHRKRLQGEQVITPFTPTDWKLTFDGETVSLWPSIGNWNFSCRSHYIIRHSRIVSADPWDDDHIRWGRRRDKKKKEQYYSGAKIAAGGQNLNEKPKAQELGLWDRFKKKIRKRRP